MEGELSGTPEPTNTSSVKEAEPEDSGEASHISLAEVVRMLFGSKAPGVDEIRPEMLKDLDIVGLSWLTCLFNVTCRTGTVPGECSNYRGIALLSLTWKVYFRLLKRMLGPIVGPQIQEGQWRFRPGRGTTDQLFTFAVVLRGSWEFDHPVYM